MIIYSMTATFGKLEHQTLTLQPGLNILEAPNEWGKSTWCAFLTAMFYGIDTRARSSASVLAEKEKYAPWSGLPMEGSMNLCWNGKNITIQRRTKGRTPMGVFRAFETDTGMDIPELTASNCGQTLLGVERSVFLRAGFLKLSDLPVTQDDALRYRLNALVTTGDESATGVLLEQKLKELKNRCRYNKTGLLPQAKEQLETAEKTLSELQALSAQAEGILTHVQELESYIHQLKNHKKHLLYEDAQEDAAQVAAAQTALNQAKLQADVLEYTCRDIPSREEANRTIQTVRSLQQQWLSLQSESRALPAMPEHPPVPASMVNIPPEKAVETARADAGRYRILRKRSGRFLPWIMLVLMISLTICGVVLWNTGKDHLWVSITGGVILILGMLRFIFASSKNHKKRMQAQLLIQRYGDSSEINWIRTAEAYARSMEQYNEDRKQAEIARKEMDQKLSALDQESGKLTEGLDIQIYLEQWQQVLSAWDSYDEARQNCLRFERQLQAIRSIVRTPEAPDEPDELDSTMEETNNLITDCQLRQRQQQQLLGQCLGKMDAIGSEEALTREIFALKNKIQRLEQVCTALEIAQNALAEATSELQRRFAPKITARAQEIFHALTGGRYEQLRFSADFSLSASAAGEDTLRSSLWRSDGTGDQMYLALRLAVAEVLTPQAPLILDDALVRFDDQRLSQALRILDREAGSKQVLLFTCQGREKKLHTNSI